MTRRALPLLLAWFVLAGTVTTAAAPALVCRFTGMPMPSAPVSSTPLPDCCARPAAADEDRGGGTSFQAGAGCCHLAPAPGRASSPALRASSPFAYAAVLPSMRPFRFDPVRATDTPLRAVPRNESIPRAPPRPSTPPRAPPSFS